MTREYEKAAGGFGALSSTLRHLARETGLWRGSKTLLRMNQSSGFDCPGCAWPEPAHRSAFEFCENGAKAVAEEATRQRATPAVFAEHSIDALRQMTDFELGRLGRITHPMRLDAGDTHYRPVGWDEVFQTLAEAFQSMSSPDRAVFYTSGRTSNEAAFLYQLFARALGTNNLPDCSNMCHESSGVGLGEVIGVGKGTVSLEDFDKADAIFVIGQNPGTNHPRMLSTLRDAAKRGAHIISVNPLREPGLVRFAHPQKVFECLGKGVPIASMFVPVRLGGDVALFRGVAKAVMEREAASPGTVLDQAFIDTHTSGFADYKASVEGTSWAAIQEVSGIAQEDIERLADVYCSSERVIACWAMGLTQHENAVANIQEVVNVLLLRGNIGREGAGACPVRGHSNVQGDRTVGITHRPKRAFLEALEREFGFATPAAPGLDTVDAISAMAAGEVDVFFAMGGNFYSATPDTEVVEAGFTKCAVTAHVSTKVNRSHLYPGKTGLILPCLGRTERDERAGRTRFVSVEDSMSMVHRSQGTLAPAGGELMSEPDIVAALAEKALPDTLVPWSELVEDYDRIRDRIERVVPGFDNYNERVRSERGFRLPNGARERSWKTDAGKAMFTVHPLPDLSLPAGRLRMMTVRSHDQYNTTIYGLDDRYRGIKNERRVVFVGREDAEEQGLEDGEWVDLVSEYQGKERRVDGFRVVLYDVPRGTCVTYFPEANPLVPLESRAAKSNTPASKSVVVRLLAKE